ncbi:YczE/YyaS/YitT family protein [Bacillus sp. 2205SS5-2]|uniref:YczE/YyaS/YitT family protein n=1 Tax=Bacillus sp. 2205SS5-2 TaxID=3109031 RepID=UPI0030054BD6
MNLYKILFYLVGLFIISFGVTLTIKADLGAGAWDALNVGLSTTIGLTVGTWVIIVGSILIFLNAYLLKERPDFLAFITVLLVGFFIDFWLIFALSEWTPDNLAYRVVLLLLGLGILSFGIATYLQANYPLIPIDNFMMALRARFKLNLSVAKTVGELTALILALLFQGPIGIGTLIITFGIGPSIQFFFPKMEMALKKLQHKQVSPSH